MESKAGTARPPVLSTAKAAGNELPLKLQSQWERAAPLPPTQRLNAAFDQIPVSSFPHLAQFGSVIEVRSDATLAEALEVLSNHHIFSAPIRDVEADADASWMEKYLGMVDFSGIIHWLLHQSELGMLGTTGEVGGTEKSPGTRNAAALGGDSLEEFISSNVYKEAKVTDMAGTFRWAPFISVQPTDSLLTVLLLLSKYRMKSLPVVKSGQGSIFNFITQGDVVHMLCQCSGLSWFDKLGQRSLSDLGLPITGCNGVIQVEEDSPVSVVFKMMNKYRVGGVPVVSSSSSKVIGNISASDVQFLLMLPEIFKDYRPLTAGKFLGAVRKSLQDKEKDSPLLRRPLTCTPNETLKDSIGRLDSARIHRIYTVDTNQDLIGVITLRDIISTFVDEPQGYFGDFFDGVVPASPRY